MPRKSRIMAYELSDFDDSGIVNLSSAGAPWADVQLELVGLPRFEAYRLYSQYHVVLVHLDRRCDIDFYAGKRVIRAALHPGEIGTRPAGVMTHARVHNEHGKLFIALSDQVLRKTAEQLGCNHVEPLLHWGDRDHQIAHLALALKAELEQGCPCGRMFGEAVCTALALRLLQKYSAFPLKTDQNKSGGLSPCHLRQTLGTIQDRLNEDLSLYVLAADIDLSPYHFARMFKESTGVSPHRYMLEKRIERAQLMLGDRHLTVADIATRLGFADQSHFGNTFKRFTGSTPTAFRRQSFM